MAGRPLVSILIPNYNYGRYLSACLESVVQQTYENLQVVLVDNHSSDDSWDIAQAFQSRYPDRLRIYRNDENIGGSRNHTKACALQDPRSEYLIYVSSDDMVHPQMVQRCMALMEAHPTVGFVLFHRNAMDTEGKITQEPPFYDCSCVIPSTQQMEVFMMAGIGVATQCFRSRAIDALIGQTGGYLFDISGDWFYNFCFASLCDMGYLQDPLCTYRTHAANVTSGAIRNLTNSLEHVRMLHAFRELALRFDRPSVAQRFRPAMEKLGTMCLRYCTQLMRENEPRTATQYLHLACALKPGIQEADAWQELRRILRLPPGERGAALDTFEAASPQKRLCSYAPPAGSIRL